MFVIQRSPSMQPFLGFARARHGRRALRRSRGGGRLGGLRLHLNAAWHSATLDRRLAEGVDPQASPVLALRARKLTGARGRRRVADGLAGALRSAKDTTPVITAALRPDSRELLAARTVLTALERGLRDSEAVTAQGVAMLGGLLTDASSPLYLPRGPGELASRLRAAAAALEPRTTREACDAAEREKAVRPSPSLNALRAAAVQPPPHHSWVKFRKITSELAESHDVGGAIGRVQHTRTERRSVLDARRRWFGQRV
jgi:hypothetical protein